MEGLLMREQIKEIVIKSLEELNEQLEEEKFSDVLEDTVIFGKNASLDSFDFVNLIVIIEGEIFDALGKSITIVSEKAFSKKYNPFATVGRIVDFIVDLLGSEQV